LTTTELIETRDQTWSPVLNELRAEALDCIQTGLAALADREHGDGAHLVLGARLGFTITPGSPPTAEVPVEQRLAEAEQLAGLRVVERRDGLDGPALRDFADEIAGPLYVVADTFAMAWTPYRGQRHMDHSFLLIPSGDTYTVVDPYHNDTQWGSARPGVWRLVAADFDAAIGTGSSAMVITAARRPRLDPGTVLAANARGLTAAGPDMAGYLAQVRDGLTEAAAVEAMVLDVWLIARSRLLHAEWLRTVPGLPAALVAETGQQADEWLRLTAQSYLGLRRVQRGAALPPSIVERLAELLDGDVELAVRLAERVAPEGPVAAAVREAVRTVLRLDEAGDWLTSPFRSLPNFNSFRLVDIVELVESRLGVTVDAEDLTVDALRDVDSLTRLFARAVGRADR
jgi:acyl carrier protein